MKRLSAFVVLLIVALAANVQAQSHYLGPIQTDSLYAGYPDFAANHYRYQPDSAAVAWLAACSVDIIDIVMVLGTWCGDSKRNAPALLKSLDLACNPLLQANFYGIAPGKLVPSDIIKKYGIAYVPTVVVYHKGKEVGRIVEHPYLSMEQDLVALLKPLI